MPRPSPSTATASPDDRAADATDSDAEDNASSPDYGRTGVFQLALGQQLLDIDAGMYRAKIAGRSSNGSCRTATCSC